MENAKRYAVTSYDNWGEIKQDEDGPYVLYADYAALKAQLEDARALKVFAEDGLNKELAQVRAQLEAAKTGLKDAHAVHVNMMRGEIAKLTPAQVAHLYSPDECAEIVSEIQRQHPQLPTPPQEA